MVMLHDINPPTDRFAYEVHVVLLNECIVAFFVDIRPDLRIVSRVNKNASSVSVTELILDHQRGNLPLRRPDCPT